MKNLAFAALFGMSLAACSAPGVAPKDANLAQSIGNLSSGEYDKQLQRKQLTLDAAQQELATAQRQQQQLQAELAAKKQELSALDAELVALERSNQQLEKTITAQRAQTRQQQARKQQALARLKGVRKKIAAAKAARPAPSADNRAYKQQISHLKGEIKVLQEMALM